MGAGARRDQTPAYYDEIVGDVVLNERKGAVPCVSCIELNSRDCRAVCVWTRSELTMELQTHSARKYPTSTLLKSSAGLGWSTISAELRSHDIFETPVIAPQHVELCLTIDGNNDGHLLRPNWASACAPQHRDHRWRMTCTYDAERLEA